MKLNRIQILDVIEDTDIHLGLVDIGKILVKLANSYLDD